VIKYSDLIGKPFVYGGRGETGYDCYGLIMEILKRLDVQPEEYGYSTDENMIHLMMTSAEQTSHWQECQLQPNCILLIKLGRFVRHVGFYLGGNKFIHCWEKSNGVVVETLSTDWEKRIVGCYQYAE
jgi:lipoprotein Spr